MFDCRRVQNQCPYQDNHFGIFLYHDPMFGLLDKPINSNSTVGAFQQNPLAICGMSSTRKEGMHPSVSVQPPSASPFAKAHQGKWFLRVSLDHVSDRMVHCFSNAAAQQVVDVRVLTLQKVVNLTIRHED